MLYPHYRTSLLSRFSFPFVFPSPFPFPFPFPFPTLPSHAHTDTQPTTATQAMEKEQEKENISSLTLCFFCLRRKRTQHTQHTTTHRSVHEKRNELMPARSCLSAWWHLPSRHPQRVEPQGRSAPRTHERPHSSSSSTEAREKNKEGKTPHARGTGRSSTVRITKQRAGERERLHLTPPLSLVFLPSAKTNPSPKKTPHAPQVLILRKRGE